MNVAEAVSGKRGIEGVRGLLFGAESQELVQKTLSSLLNSPAVLKLDHPYRVRFKPGHKLTAYYDLRIPAYGIRPVAVIWRGHRSAGWRKVQDQISVIETEAVARGVLAPFRALATEARERNLRIQVAPLDVDFPQLARAFDPQYVTHKFPGLFDANQNRLPSPSARGCRVSVVRYQPGLRHVLRYEFTGLGTDVVAFAKLSPPDDSARAYQVSMHVSRWLCTHGTGLSCVEPFAFDPADALVLYREAAGLPLSQHLERSNRDLTAWLRRAGEMLRLLHCSPRPITAKVESRDAEAEMAEAAGASDFVEAILPEEGAMIRALLECAREVYPRLPQEPRTLTHGDLKLEHLWVTESGLTLMDFDTCRLDDPALDVGTFLADLRICCSLCDRPGAEEAQSHFLDGYSSGALSERLVRARFYEALELVKMTVRRVQVSDQAWTSQTEKLVRRARLVMERLRETLGLPTKNPLSNATPQSSTAWEGSVAGKTPRRQARPGAIGDA